MGSTGRNFAAGMSGGIAYVIDEVGDFTRRCNLAMVELETYRFRRRPTPGVGADPTVGRADGRSAPPRRMAASHAARATRRFVDSSRAREILDRFDEYLPQFVKVVPMEFRRALEEQRQLAAGAR